MKRTILILMAYSVILSTFSQTAPTPFPCSSNAYQTTGSTPNLYQFNFVANTFVNLGAITLYTTGTNVYGAFQLRAVGYNPADNFAYGLINGTSPPILIKLGANAYATTIGNLSSTLSSNPLNDFTTSINIVAADFGPNGYLYVMIGGSTNKVYAINVSTAVIVSVFTTSVPFDKGDMVWSNNDQKFYAVGTDAATVSNSGQAFKLYSFPVASNGNTATVSSITTNLTANSPITNIGAMYIDNSGNVYGANNGDGNIYLFDRTSGIATLKATGTATTFNDGFSCPSVQLPLRLLSFGATKSGNDIHIAWQTASEMDIDNIGLEYSTDATAFINVTTVKPIGNSTSLTNNYSYDFMPTENTVYYFRLKINDIDGYSAYSNIISIKNNAQNGAFNVYPSALAQGGSIHVENINGPSLTVYSVGGIKITEVKLSAGQSNAIIQTSSWSKGMYIIYDGNHEYKKVIVY